MNNNFGNFSKFKPYTMDSGHASGLDDVKPNYKINTKSPGQPPFVQFQASPDEYHDNVQYSERVTNMKFDQVGHTFFSNDNIKRIQKKIKREFYLRTKREFKLDVDQDEHKLLIAMQSVYAEKGRYLPTHMVRQVKQLNSDLVDYILPDMITEAKQYYGYMRDINQPLKPIARPMNVSSAGTKTHGMASILSLN